MNTCQTENVGELHMASSSANIILYGRYMGMSCNQQVGKQLEMLH